MCVEKKLLRHEKYFLHQEQKSFISNVELTSNDILKNLKPLFNKYNSNINFHF